MKKGSKVLIPGVGPGGTIAQVVSSFYDRLKVTYYDARDGQITIWVHVNEVTEWPSKA